MFVVDWNLQFWRKFWEGNIPPTPSLAEYSFNNRSFFPTVGQLLSASVLLVACKCICVSCITFQLHSLLRLSITCIIIWWTRPMYIMQIKPIRPGSVWDKGALQLASLLVTADGGVFAWPDLSSWSQRLRSDAFTLLHRGTNTLKKKVRQVSALRSFFAWGVSNDKADKGGVQYRFPTNPRSSHTYCLIRRGRPVP